MVSREYLKAKIDTLPDELVIGIDKYIAKQTEKSLRKAKRNAEYLAMLDRSRKEIAAGRGIEFTVEELENMTELPVEDAKAFAAKRALEKGVILWE